MVWASLDPETADRQVRLDIERPARVKWLQSLLDMGGFCLPRDSSLLTKPGLRARQQQPKPITTFSFARQDALAAITQQVRAATVPVEADPFGSVSALVLPINCIEVNDAFRAFHRAFCVHLAEDDVSLTRESPELGNDPQVDAATTSTFAVAMATAAILDHADSVALLASQRPAAMLVDLDLKILGDHSTASTYAGARRGYVRKDREPPNFPALSITPFACALQMSSMGSIQAMLDAGYPRHMPLGHSRTIKPPAPFCIDSIAEVLAPTCRPDVYGELLRQRVLEATPAEAKTIATNAIQLLHDAHRSESTAGGLLPTLRDVGAFDGDVVGALSAACTVGDLMLTARMLERVEWNELEPLFGRATSPLTLATAAAVNSSEDRSKLDACGELVIRAAIAAGRTDVVLKSYEAISFLNRDMRRVDEPMATMVRVPLLRSLRAILDAGYDATARRDSEATSVMCDAEAAKNGTAALIQAHTAHRHAANLLSLVGSAPRRTSPT